MIYGLQDFFFLATWWVGYFFTAVQEFFSITFVLHAIFFFRQALAGNFFSKSPTPPPPPPQELNGRPLNSRKARLLCDANYCIFNRQTQKLFLAKTMEIYCVRKQLNGMKIEPHFYLI